MTTDTNDRPDSLSPEKLQLFAATLAGLPAEEIRKAKSLYVRNAISEYRATESGLEAFGQAQGCLAVIPIFWPILGAQKKMMATGLQLGRERINNALEVWKDDLRGETFAGWDDGAAKTDS